MAVFVVWSYGGISSAHAEQLKVGKIQMNQVYKEYKRVDNFKKKIETARQKMRQLQKEIRKPEADKEKIKQKMKELRDEINRERTQIGKDIKEAGEKVAKKQNLSLVVLSILYKEEDIQLQDITQPVIQLLNKSYKEEGGLSFF